MSTPKFDVLILELIPFSQAGSGFVREDTVELPEDQQVRVMHPKNRVIMNTSIVRQESKETPGTFINVPTRFIYNQEEIFKDKQEEAKMTTSIRDKVVFIKGIRTVPNDGAFVGEYKWAKNHAQNESNPNRPTNADGSPLLQPVFREVRAKAKAHDKNLYDFQLAQAMGLLYKLIKEKAGGYEYQEDEIDAICSNFAVQADSPEQKWRSLVELAKADPELFLNTAKTSEQTVSIEIKHALQLKLIKIEEGAIFYTEGENPLIKKFSNAQNDDKKKLDALGSYFQKVEGKEAYELFKAKLEEAKVAAIQ